VHRAIRTMLADGVTDRFTRFVPKDQFASMTSYDITGVGLNISTAAELEDKTEYSANQVITVSSCFCSLEYATYLLILTRCVRSGFG